MVLLDYDDLLAEEIAWGSSTGAEIIPLLDGAAPFLRASRNAVVKCDFQKLQLAGQEDSVKSIMAGLGAHALMGKRPLRIQGKGVVETYWTAVAALAPERTVGIYLRGRAGIYTRHSLVMTGITPTATGIPPLVPAPYAPVGPGDFNAAGYVPVGPGDFSRVGFSPSNPGSFESGENLPSPGVFGGMIITGTLTPDATGTIPLSSTDTFGLPTYSTGAAYPRKTIEWSDPLEIGAGRWILRYFTGLGVGSAWASANAFFNPAATPANGTAWAPTFPMGAGAAATGTPIITAQ